MNREFDKAHDEDVVPRVRRLRGRVLGALPQAGKLWRVGMHIEFSSALVVENSGTCDTAVHLITSSRSSCEVLCCAFLYLDAFGERIYMRMETVSMVCWLVAE